MRKTLLSVVAVLAFAVANGAEITEREAARNAVAFFKDKTGRKASAKRVATPAKTLAVGAGGAAREMYYVFNMGDGEGFVVTSGDDAVEKVLGYSESGVYERSCAPAELNRWLDEYERQIRYAVERGIKNAAEETRAYPAIAPLVTAKWNHYSPYNMYLPAIEGTQAPVGCVGVALAQVLYYHRSAEATNTIPAYTTRVHGVYRPELAPTTFDWGIMQDYYSWADASTAAGREVARLMLYCTQAVRMEFQKYMSAAYLSPYYISEYFGFDASITERNRRDFTYAEWDELIYNELREGRPVLYSGATVGVGHQFVCDGYDGRGYYHINWGWGGVSDGYFLLSILKPSSDYYGSEGEDGFSMGQSALINVMPRRSDPSAGVPPLIMGVSGSETATYTRGGTEADFHNVRTTLGFYNNSRASQTYYGLGVALFRGDSMISVVGRSESGTSLDYGRYAMLSLHSSFGAGLDDGEYRLQGVWKAGADDEWQLCAGGRVQYYKAVIEGKTLTLASVGPDYSSSFRLNSVETTGWHERGEELEVKINLTNLGNHTLANLYIIFDGVAVTAVGVALDPGQTGDVAFHFIPKTVGTFPLVVSNAPSGGDTLHIEQVSITEPRQANLGISLSSLKEGDTEASIQATAEITNKASTDFDHVLMESLYAERDDRPDTYALVQKRTRPFALAAGATARYDFSFGNLEKGKRYFVALHYRTMGYETGISSWTLLTDIEDITTSAGHAAQPIYDLRGNMVGTSLHTDRLPSGIYISGGRKFVKR